MVIEEFNASLKTQTDNSVIRWILSSKSFPFYGAEENFRSVLNTCKDVRYYVLTQKRKTQLCVYHTQLHENFMMPEKKNYA